ncbi:HAMP domain-containing sensor histidine kinase [Achromobacter sp. Marseille-Q0513]|uniref:sensor histidine kinase n=1 Tax=Achromobacter sp. Marseille-Q0513 TaxID=2829161 RepID=UPI0020134FDE|nr:HAMP domain-containing sensor histidine kinase [Achromobacter sp. Marseille-Q0513]
MPRSRTRLPPARAAAASTRRWAGALCALLAWPGAARAQAELAAQAGVHAGLIAGAALACALVCAAAWTRTRDSVQAAGVVFLLLEGLFRTLPNLLPAGALQAGSYAALLALTAPFLAGSAGLRGLAAACRWGSIGLAALASLALIFIYETHDGAASAAIAGACAAASLPLTAALLAAGARPGPRRVACLVLAAGHALSVWLIGRDAWPGAGAGSPASLLELARLLLVALALWYCALADRHARASASSLPAQTPSAAGHQAQDELRLAELAGALDTQRQMNALLSHELRAPLATISAAAQSLDMILAGNGEAVDNRLARIHRSVTRMTELMEQLLTQDRREEQALTPRGEAIDLAAMARDVVTAMRPDTAHALVLNADGALPAYCDRSLTSVVLRNLIHNAVKYSPASESIRIEAGAGMADGVHQAWIAVVDRGPGIGEEDQQRIFEPRFRRAAHRETSGLGVGLYLARRICESQGGSLTMTSRIGAGSRFVITLPVSPPA